MDWVAIDSQRSDLSAVPTTKTCCFNTSTNHFCCVNVWGPGTTHSLLPSVSVVSLPQCWGHTWLSFIKATAQFFKHVRIGETPVLDIPNLPELPGFTKEPVVIWLSQMCLWAMGYVSEKTGCLVFFFKWEPRLGALRTAVMPWSSLLQVQEWSTYT
jgi:hypothetical protein